MELYDKIKRFANRKLLDLKKPFYKIQEENSKGQGAVLSHITCYATGNSGDTLLSKCVRQTIGNLRGGNCWNIVDVRAKVDKKCIEKMNKTVGIIVGGGGLFLPDTNRNTVSGWQWAVSSEQLSKIEVPLIVYSVGFNYFRGQAVTEIFKENLQQLVKKADFIGLRNMGSVQAVQQMIDDELRDKIVYQPCTTTLIRKIFPDILPKKERSGRIAFNIAFDREELRYGKNKEIILRQIAKTAKQIEMRGYKIVYVLHCGKDGKFIPYLQAEQVNFQIVNTTSWLPKKTIKFYNGVDLVFGMRGHAQMVPFGLNCEIISLGTHDKMRWFLEDIDATDWLEELTCNPSNLADRLVHKFIYIHEENWEITKKRLLKQQEKLWEITIKNWRNISCLLQKYNK